MMRAVAMTMLLLLLTLLEAQAAPSRRAQTADIAVLPDQRGLGVMWQSFTDTLTQGKMTKAGDKRRLFFDTLNSIIEQYEDIDGGEARVRAYESVRTELAAVSDSLAGATNIGGVIRRHLGY